MMGIVVVKKEKWVVVVCVVDDGDGMVISGVY